MDFERIGYCPYCGSDLFILSISPTVGEIYWSSCTQRCQGALLKIVTDRYGFIVEPLELKHRYIHSRPHEKEVEIQCFT